VAIHWVYPPELLEALGSLGLAPRDRTPPAVVRAALNDLYRFELRRARDRLIGGQIEKSGYLDLVVTLRKKYWPLTLQLPAWEKICRADGADGVPGMGPRT
jgi:hypothetical protein